MRQGSPRRKAASLPLQNGESTVEVRLPPLSEEFIASLEQTASAEAGKTSGDGVRLIRGLSVFLTR
jgi:hypothetical protein